MDLIQIKKSDYSVGRLIERADGNSLIWTERFQDPGELEFHTQSINEVMDLLPERSLCGLRDSKEVIMVESHEIDRDDESGVDSLIVRGRTVDFFPENRIWTNAPYGKTISMAKKYSVRQAVEVWLWNAICNGTGNDRIKTSADYPAGNQLPNVVVTDSVPPSIDGPNISRKVQNGDVYSQMRQFLSSGKLGIRIIRPSGTSGRIVTVDGDGTFNVDLTHGIDKLRFDIFVGRDLSDRVVFSYKAGHLQDPSYLFSSQTFKTGAYIDGDPRTTYYTDPDAEVGPNTGWNRRDAYGDGGTKDDDTTADDFQDSLDDQAKKAVHKDGRHVNSVDAQISPDINLKYGRDYKLGDQVMVQGEYGAHGKKWVTEYIRTHDDNGETGYPTLSSTLS